MRYFSTDQSTEKISIIKPIKKGVFFQLFEITLYFFLLRLVMVSTGVMFVYIPGFDKVVIMVVQSLNKLFGA